MESSQNSSISSHHYAALLQTVSEMRSDLEKTTLKIMSLESQNEQLQNNFFATKEELLDTRKKYNEARESYLSAVGEKFEAEQEHDAVIERLKGQLQEKTKEFEKIRDDLIPHDIDQLRIKVQEELEIRHKQELKAMEAELEIQREKNFGTRRELERTRAEYNSLIQNQQNEINSLRVEKDELIEAVRLEALKHRQVDAPYGKDERLRTQTAKLSEQAHLIELLRDEIKAVRAEKKEATANTDQMRAKLEHSQTLLKAKIVSIEAENTGLQQKLSILEAECDKKESQIRSQRLSSDDLANRMDDARKELEDAERSWQLARNDLTRQYDSLQDASEREHREFVDQVEALRSTIDDREEALRRVQREASEMQLRAESAEREIRRAHLVQMQEMRRKCTSSELELADALQSARSAQDQMLAQQEQAAGEKDSLALEVSRLKREKEILYGKLRDGEASLDAQRKRSLSEQQELVGKASGAEKKWRDAQTHAAQLDNKLQVLNAKVSELERDRKRERDNYDQLEHRYSQMLLQVEAMKTNFHQQLQSVAPSVKERMEALQRQMKSALMKERKRSDGYKAKALEAHYRIKALGEVNHL
jgi:coiled-coil domain-containing protein 41